MIDLTDNVAIVTGAAGGIGSTTASVLSELGASVVVSDITPEIHELVTDIEDSGGTALAVEADVTDPVDVGAATDRALDVFGRIDILANIAGIFPGQAFDSMQKADWDRVIDINLTGTFNWTKAVVPSMRDRSYGRIINLSSVTGGRDGRSATFTHYAASKAGIVGFTRAAALDFGPDGITINAVLPGTIQSGAAKPHSSAQQEASRANTPVRRDGTPEDVARLIAYLGSEHSSFMTGSAVVIDGGTTIASKCTNIPTPTM